MSTSDRTKAEWIKMVLDLRRTAESYDALRCPSCSRNGLMVMNPGCPTCGGHGTMDNDAAEAYRTKATIIMTLHGIQESDLRQSTTGGVVYGNMNATPSDEAAINPDAYNVCTICGVRGRAYCAGCRPSTQLDAMFAGRDAYHCEYCHPVYAGQHNRQSAPRATKTRQSSNRRSGRYDGPTKWCASCGQYFYATHVHGNEEKRTTRGRGPTSKAYTADHGRYWYERGYHRAKNDAYYTGGFRYDDDAVAASEAGFRSRFDAGVEAGNKARAKKEAGL